MNKGLLLIVILNLLASFTYGQDFYDSLKIEADRTYNSPFVEIDVDSLNKVFFDSKNVRMLIDSSATFQVLFSYEKSWCSGPNCHFFEEIVNSLPDNLAKNKSPFFTKEKYYYSSKSYNGIELIKGTHINFKGDIFTQFPPIRNNSDKYNNKWTAFSNEKYLVFRFASIYVGNSSSYSEELIYFRKVK